MPATAQAALSTALRGFKPMGVTAERGRPLSSRSWGHEGAEHGLGLSAGLGGDAVDDAVAPGKAG